MGTQRIGIATVDRFSEQDLARIAKAKKLKARLTIVKSERVGFQSKASEREREEKKLLKQIAQVLGGTAPSRPKGKKAKKARAKAKRKSRKIARNAKPLHTVLAEALKRAKRPMAAAELTRKIRARGFKTTSKPDVFRVQVANALRLSKEFAKKSGKYVLKANGKAKTKKAPKKAQATPQPAAAAPAES